MESAKRDYGNKFRGSKNGGKELWGGLQWPENRKIWRQTEAAAVVFSGQISAHPASVGREISRSAFSGGDAPPRLARVALWWPVVPLFVQSPTACNGQNDPTRVHKFGELF